MTARPLRAFATATFAATLLAGCMTATLPTAPLVTPMASAPIAADIPLTRIAFGSCLKEEDELSILSAISAEDPDLFLLIGDNVYGDPRWDDPEAEDPAMPKMLRSYDALAERVDFTRFRQSVPMLTTWDDHDYGANDAGADFPFRERAQDLYNDAWAVPADDPRRQRPGVYTSGTYGPEGQRVQVILLDTRYFRGPLTETDERGAPGKERYLPSADTSSTMLGEDQWAWLEEALTEPADLRLLVSSIQVHSDAHGWEAWRTLPHERERLYGLLAATDTAGETVILSGDRHAGSIYRRDAAPGQPVVEVTASSLNAPVSLWKQQALDRGEAPQPPEQGPFQLYPMQDDINYGMIDIDWTARQASVRVVEPGGETYRETVGF